MLLAGKRAAVVGVGPGLGRDLALALAGAGADVALGARSEHRLERVAAEVRDMGRRAYIQPTDITDESSCAGFVRFVEANLSGLDLLVSNAAHGGGEADLLGGGLSDLQTAMDVNVFGTLKLIQAVAPLMERSGGGTITVVNTMLAETVIPGFGSYAVSKAALLHATRYLARELGPKGIRINSVMPGAIWGKALQRYYEQLADRRGTTWESVKAEAEASTALGFIPSSAEIAATAVYLSSDLSKPVTGQGLRVNAGQWEAQPDGRV